MTRFRVLRNKDQADAYISALLSAGFQETNSVHDADFVLADWERMGVTRRDLYAYGANGKPIFVYPHTPYSYFIWDGIQSLPNVTCNFVPAQGPKMGMQSFGYPNRVEVVGFHCGPVRPFQPTDGSRLLFAPAHPLHDGKYASAETEQETQRAYEWVLDNRSRFESVTVRCTRGAVIEYTDVRYDHVDPYREPRPNAAALFAIENADLVLSVGTFAYLSAAAGKPTIMYGSAVPSNRAGYAKHYDLYRSHFEYPLLLERMQIDAVAMVCRESSPALDTWRELNIGEPFDTGKFLAVILECLQ